MRQYQGEFVSSAPDPKVKLSYPYPVSINFVSRVPVVPSVADPSVVCHLARSAPGIVVHLGSVVGAQGWFQGTVLFFFVRRCDTLDMSCVCCLPSMYFIFVVS